MVERVHLEEEVVVVGVALSRYSNWEGFHSHRTQMLTSAAGLEELAGILR
jgi:hypothetical protein